MAEHDIAALDSAHEGDDDERMMTDAMEMMREDSAYMDMESDAMHGTEDNEDE